MDSLMAYGSSDEESDIDDDAQPSVSGPSNSLNYQVTFADRTSDTGPALDPPISDEEDDFLPVSVDSNKGFQLPPPKNIEESASTKGEEPMESSNLLAGLPKPKAGQTAFADSEETELEDFVKPKQSESVGTENKPPPPSLQAKKRKTVQITIPELPVDSDEDEPSIKKPAVEPPVPSKSKCGLFAVLPAPKNFAASKETGKMFLPAAMTKSSAAAPSSTNTNHTAVKAKPSNETVKNNLFVPASVGRKNKISSRSAFNLDTGMMMTTKTKPNVKVSNVHNGSVSDSVGSISQESLGKKAETKPHRLLPGVPAEDSDDDDEGTSNFFSLGTDDTTGEKQELSASSYIATASVSTLPAVSKRKQENNSAQGDVVMPSSRMPEPLTFCQTAGPEVQDAPLQFKGPGMAGAYASGSQKMHGPMAGFSGSYGDVGTSSAQYNYAGMEDVEMQEGEEGGMEVDDQSGQDTLMRDQEFLKMQGKGNRGKEEISFIDVHQDDQISDVNVLKNLTEESDMMSHSKKKNKDMPSSQQKRKHQITYLAFRAKEREVELKNQWSENRHTKKQTQAKYGF